MQIIDKIVNSKFFLWNLSIESIYYTLVSLGLQKHAASNSFTTSTKCE